MAEIDHRDAEPLGDHEPDELEFHYRDPDKQKDDTGFSVFDVLCFLFLLFVWLRSKRSDKGLVEHTASVVAL
ncbi:hypothetical protein LWI29_034570 [Acer saccharum]|uniref:Uncharacterized protein n=1 Tax=Acer saccharum TaxID=4024 RepID=A0AA39REV9_ACESA|nr:hypothetical protein LWI29_034570 [Acer saccharum]